MVLNLDLHNIKHCTAHSHMPPALGCTAPHPLMRHLHTCKIIGNLWPLLMPFNCAPFRCTLLLLNHFTTSEYQVYVDEQLLRLRQESKTESEKKEKESLKSRGLSDTDARSFIKSRRTQERLNDQMKALRNENQNRNENGGYN